MMWSRSEGVGPDEILARLARDKELGLDLPSRRQVERWIADAAGQGPAWSLASEADPGAAAIVLRALARLTLATSSAFDAGAEVTASGRHRPEPTRDEAAWMIRRARRPAVITEDEAAWTVRIARASPGQDPFWAFRIGILYRDRVTRGHPTHDLDVFLGAAPWADPVEYLSIIQNGDVDEWFSEGWHPPGELVIREYYARQERGEGPG